MGPGQGNGLGLYTLPTESTRHQTEYSTYVTNRLSYVNRRSLVHDQTISHTSPDDLSYVTRRSLVHDQTISHTSPTDSRMSTDDLSYTTRQSLIRHQTISRTSPDDLSYVTSCVPLCCRTPDSQRFTSSIVSPKLNWRLSTCCRFFNEQKPCKNVTFCRERINYLSRRRRVLSQSKSHSGAAP